jgi:hypothetical protein
VQDTTPETNMEAGNNVICEAIAKAADLIAEGKNILVIRSALGAAHAVLQRNRQNVSQFQMEAHLESLQQLIALAGLQPGRL